MLLELGTIDLDTSNTITFNLKHFKSMLSHQLAFQIATKVCGKKFHRSVLDEDTSTSVMSLSCWRFIGSLEFNHSPTTLKYFDGHVFQPYGCCHIFSTKLGRGGCLYSCRGSQCTFGLLYFIGEKLVLCHDCYFFDSLSNSIFLIWENCNYQPT